MLSGTDDFIIVPHIELEEPWGSRIGFPVTTEVVNAIALSLLGSTLFIGFSDVFNRLRACC